MCESVREREFIVARVVVVVIWFAVCKANGMRRMLIIQCASINAHRKFNYCIPLQHAYAQTPYNLLRRGGWGTRLPSSESTDSMTRLKWCLWPCNFRPFPKFYARKHWKATLKLGVLA